MELVRAVFSAEESGFLDKGDNKTIIEEQSSLLSLLAAGKRSCPRDTAHLGLSRAPRGAQRQS